MHLRGERAPKTIRTCCGAEPDGVRGDSGLFRTVVYAGINTRRRCTLLLVRFR